MTWKIGPLEGSTADELRTLLRQDFDRQYGQQTGPEADMQLAQFEQLVGCLDHQMTWIDGAQSFAIELEGHAIDPGIDATGNSEPYALIRMAARPGATGRFTKETGQVAREHTHSGPPGG